MRGLVLKDFYSSRAMGRSLLVMAIAGTVFTLTMQDNGFYLIVMIPITLSSVSLSVFSMDEASNWGAFSAALPMPRKMLVRSRYMFLLSWAALCLGCAGLVAIANLAFGYPAEALAMLLSGTLITSVYALCQAIIYPIVYRSGYEKTRVLNAVVSVAPGLLIIFLALRFGTSFFHTFNGVVTCLAVIAVTLAALYVSYTQAVRIVEQTEY